ncbi:YlbD family protein [Bacillus sp. HMF5848]|uniref:YlbD family protein n=1 Tax=Bacillus sp. HMF5848 TaxID=2495421 RepID=UPI00163B5B83|nr:YlbD family protein [Bacillus sp. HMF5848]
MAKQLHPSVQQFKEFVKNHPKLTKDVRAGKTTWQEIYEDWYIFGEEDEKWNSYRAVNSNESNEDSQQESSGVMSTILNSLKSLDGEKLQVQISNLNGAISAIQNVLQQFQTDQNSSNNTSGATQDNRSPFVFRKD